MEQYRTEEEQVEALKKWWEENGRSTIVAIIVALGLGCGWQGWQRYEEGEAEAASERYQDLLQQISQLQPDADQQAVVDLAGEIRTEYSRSTYAQFAALHMARLAVERGDMAEAEAQLRWVLGRAGKGSDTHQLAQLRLARVLASNGDLAQALAILESADGGSYLAAYTVAKGDTLLMLERTDEAREAYSQALILAARGEGGQVNLGMVQQKLQSISPVEPRELSALESLEAAEPAAGGAMEASPEAVPTEE